MFITTMRRIHFVRHARGSHRVKIWAGPARGWISRSPLYEGVYLPAGNWLCGHSALSCESLAALD